MDKKKNTKSSNREKPENKKQEASKKKFSDAHKKLHYPAINVR